jgi:hypothetical protein
MNLRLIALRVGDELKYDSTVNEIGRLASSFFRFQREPFSHDSITSQRAQLIYDWLMALGKQRMTESERSALVAKFCLGVSPEAHRTAVEAILVEGGIDSGEATQEERAAFVGRGFHPEVVACARKLFLQRNYFHAVFEAPGDCVGLDWQHRDLALWQPR